MPPRRVPRRDAKAPHHPWHYYQPGFDEPIKAHSEKDLIEAVEKFRVDNDISGVENAEADVKVYHRSITPGFKGARTKPGVKAAPKRADQRTLIDKVRTWTKLSRQRPWKLEEAEVALERAAICMSCPENTQAKLVSLCSPCIKALDRDVVILTKNKSVNKDLGVCAAVFHPNQVAVLAPVEQLGRSLSLVEETPKECWLRSLTPCQEKQSRP